MTYQSSLTRGTVLATVLNNTAVETLTASVRPLAYEEYLDMPAGYGTCRDLSTPIM